MRNKSQSITHIFKLSTRIKSFEISSFKLITWVKILECKCFIEEVNTISLYVYMLLKPRK